MRGVRFSFLILISDIPRSQSPDFSDVLDPGGARMSLLQNYSPLIQEELKEIQNSNIKLVVRSLTEEDFKYLDRRMHFPHKQGKKIGETGEINMQLARRFLMDFVLDNPVFRVDSPKKLLACLREYFILNPAEGSFNERGIPFWAIPYIPKSNHF